MDMMAEQLQPQLGDPPGGKTGELKFENNYFSVTVTGDDEYRFEVKDAENMPSSDSIMKTLNEFATRYEGEHSKPTEGGHKLKKWAAELYMELTGHLFRTLLSCVRNEPYSGSP